MKRLMILMAVLTLSVGAATAQRCLPGQAGIEFSAGFINGVKPDTKQGKAFYAGISHHTYNKKGNRWVFGAEYMQREFAYRATSLPVAQITAEAGYYLRLLADPSKTVFLSVGLSALAGYESLNWGERLLYDGARLVAKDGFIYGAAVTLELGCYVTDRLVMVLRARGRAMFNSAIGRFHFQAGIGLKISSRTRILKLSNEKRPLLRNWRSIRSALTKWGHLKRALTASNIVDLPEPFGPAKMRNRLEDIYSNRQNSGVV